MRESVIDILCCLFDDILPECDGDDTDLEQMADRLYAEGFAHEDVRRAMDWFYSFGSLAAPVLPNNAVALRVFSPQERDYLGSECQNFLYGLLRSSVITPDLLEVVIERALALEEPLDVDTLRWVALMVVMNAQPAEDAMRMLWQEQWLYAETTGMMQ